MSVSDSRRPVLAAAIAVLGLTVPILPRLVVPLIVPAEYVDTLDKIFSGGSRDTLLLFAWSAIPFFILAGLTLVLEPTPPRLAGHACALAAGLITGYVVHIPSTYYGMNFGIAAFPFYAIVVMPAGYLIGRAAAVGMMRAR